MNETIRRWAVPHDGNRNVWVIATAVTAVAALALSLTVGVFHVGSSTGAMETQLTDLREEVAQKEDISAAQSDRRGEMAEMKTIEVQQQEIMNILLGRSGK